MNSRYEKYMQFVNGGSAVVPISYVADVLGVTYTEAVCDLQEMATLGYLGSGAYVNYKDKTLVLKNFAAEKQGAANQRPRPRPRTRANTAPRGYNNMYRGPVNAPRRFGLSSGKRAVMITMGLFILVFMGIPLTLDSLDMFFYSGFASYWLPDVLQGLVFSGIGTGLFCTGILDKKRTERMEKYCQIIGGRPSVSVETLASHTMTSERKVRRDLEIMIRKNYLGPMAHMSKDGTRLVLQYEEEMVTKPPKKKEETKVEDRYDAILKEIRQLNDAIPDEAVSERIYKIEDITAKIFAFVKEHPEKESEIKTLMSHHLPITLKLLRKYSVLEKQGVKGDNIDGSIKNIEKTLDKVVLGFTRLLDNMFQAEAIDISSDIDVLESMMAQDGLSGAFEIMPDKEEDKEKDGDIQLKF